MKSLLRRTLVLAAALGAAACDPGDSPRFSGDVRRGLDEGSQAAATWIAEARTASPSDEAVLATGYLERLRLGLGSPFRLADYALADPRLTEDARRQLAWAILGRTMAGQSYEVEAGVFDRLSRPGAGPGSGATHLRLITDAITEARDPRTGELAVRLAYALASAEGTLARRAPAVAAQSAAMLRDRMIAARDVRTLLYTAESNGADPLSLLPRWRRDRYFQVEQPALSALPADVEREAMELAPRLAEALRGLPLRPPESRPHELARASLLGKAAAQRLRALNDSIAAPPQAPVAIAARMYRNELLEQPWISAGMRDARARFVAAARNDESFAAELALLDDAGPHDIAPAMTALAAAVGMRTYAQEPVWFPGFGGPSARELEERYGLAAITFNDSVPAAWRPYLRRMVDLALADLHRVLPALDVSGLSIHFGGSADQLATLAMHDPSRRRLLLPPATSAGTIAHEVAHDLDWQVALRRYNVRGDYASDRSTRRRGDRLAMQMRDLAHGLLEAPRAGEAAVHATRPAEIFARNVDWFVAVALAADGRSNGYLTSVQDDILTGYGTVRPPDVTGSAGDALMSILDEVAPVYPSTRQSFLRTFGTSRSLTPYDLVRHVLAIGEHAGDEQAPLSPLRLDSATAGAVRIAAVADARNEAFDAIDAWVCRAPAASHDRNLERARRELVADAAAARGRGLALRQAAQLAGETGAAWMRRELYGAPWPLVDVDDATLTILSHLADASRELGQGGVGLPVDNFTLTTAPRGCAEVLFGR